MSRSIQNCVLAFSLLLANAAYGDFFDISDLAPANGGSWLPGSLGPDALLNDGANISATFTFTDVGGILTSEPLGAMTPTPFIDLSGGSMLDGSLQWRIDDGTTAGNYVSLSIVFSEPILDPVFTLGDIDSGSLSAALRDDSTPSFDAWQDIVTAQAFLGAAEVAGAASDLGSEVGVDVLPNIHTTTGLTLYGDGGNVPGLNDTSLMTTDGNATVKFTGFVDRLLINYYAGRPDDGINGQGPANPETQYIRLGDISFVPEASSFLLSGVIIGLMGLVTQFKQLKSRFLGA